MPKPLPVAAVAIVDAWIAANVMGAFCKDDERKQVLSAMKDVGALDSCTRSLSTALSAHCTHSPPLACAQPAQVQGTPGSNASFNEKDDAALMETLNYLLNKKRGKKIKQNSRGKRKLGDASGKTAGEMAKYQKANETKIKKQRNSEALREALKKPAAEISAEIAAKKTAASKKRD